MKTLEERIKENRITAHAVQVSDNPNMDDTKWKATASHWSITLRKPDGATLTTFFSQGSALRKPPTARDLLSCLLSDAGGVDQPFEDWANDLGYDTDSRKAEKIYHQCEVAAANLKTFLGDQFEAFMFDTEQD